MSPTNIIAIAIVIVIVSTIIFVNPRIIGLAVFQEQITQQVNLVFTESNSQPVELKSVPSSLAVSGTAKGDAKLFAEIDGRKLLVLDTGKLKTTTFKNECLDTCVLPVLGSKNIVFTTDIKDGKLSINEITYYSKKLNHPPVWNGEPKTITLKGVQSEPSSEGHREGETTIDFAPNFSDPDGNELVYLAISPEGIKTTVTGSKVTLTAENSAGSGFLELVVSDLEYSIRAKIPLEITSLTQ